MTGTHLGRSIEESPVSNRLANTVIPRVNGRVVDVVLIKATQEARCLRIGERELSEPCSTERKVRRSSGEVLEYLFDGG
jgi:hypothetical protein